jgi:hypothetical protein
MVEKITTAAATADLLGVLSTQISTSTTGSTVVKPTDMDPDQTSSPAPNGSKAETSPTVDLSAKILPSTVVSHSPLKRDDAGTGVAGEHCASETRECETLSIAGIREGKEEEEDHRLEGDLLRARDLALATSTALPKSDQEEKMQLTQGEAAHGWGLQLFE